MKRIVRATLLAASLVASLAIVACSDDREGSLYPPQECGAMTTCGSCTPLVGCGWCSTGVATGFCSSDPYSCASGASVWNWNLQGCRALADAAVGPSDAAPDAAPDAVNDAPSDAAPDAAIDAAAHD